MRYSHPALWFATAFLTASFVSSFAYSAIAVSNLNNPDFGGDDPIGTEYTSFTTGPLPATLNSVTVRLDVLNAFGLTATAAASVRADDHGVPAPVDLETLPTLSDYRGFFGDFTFPSAGLSLDPNTTYWLRLAISGSAVPHWRTTDLFTEISSYGWTIGDGSVFLGLGSVWQTHSYTGRISIDATVLPEPSLPLATCALLAAPAALTRRRHRQTD